jgi:Uma2 family endonuclease
MSTQAFETSYMSTIEHLPSGTTLLIENVQWEDYKHLIEEAGESNHFRITYSEGVLEVVSPSRKHESVKEIISHLIIILAMELDIECYPVGSTTFTHTQFKEGSEPDACFYLGESIKKIQNRDEVDLLVEPPPDIVVEVDLSSSSTKKMPFYRKIGVGEFWQYQKDRIRFFKLEEETYIENQESLNFPFLTSDVLTTFINEGLSQNIKTFKEFKRWITSIRSK